LARNTTSIGSPFRTLVTTTDGNKLQQIDPVTLEPIEIFTYQVASEKLSDAKSTGSHPAYGSDGSIYNYVLNKTSSPPEYMVFGIDHATGNGKILATVTDAPPAYIHTLFGTKNHLILIIWQADFGIKATTIVGSLLPWNPERKTLFYVIDKKHGGVISKYISDNAFFAFHRVNAYEDDSGAIVIDLPAFKDHSFLEAAHVSNLRANIGPNSNGSSKNDACANFTRYILPNHGADAKLSNGSLVTHKAVKAFELDYATSNIELPKINEKYAMKDYQYAYGIHTVKSGYFADSIIKIDTHSRQPLIWNPSTNHLPSEPIFVATPGAVAEDDGVLLTVAMDAERKKSSLVVINATSMVELGRAQLPIVMGYGFHGIFGGPAIA
jgi:torulene dioxygenase